MHYVVLALYSLDKSVPLVSSDRLAATGLSIVDWVILHTASQVGLHCVVRLVMDSMQSYTKQLRLIQLPQIPSVHCVGPAQSLGAI